MAYMVPILQVVPRHEVRTEQWEMVDSSFLEATNSLGVSSLYRICTLSRYRQIRSAAETAGREALRVYTPKDMLEIAKPSEISVIFGSDISPQEARDLCQATRVNYTRAVIAINGGPLAQDYYIADALKPPGE